MSKSAIFLCSSCGNEFNKWAGQCPACKDWNTIKEINLKNFTPLATSKNKTPTTTTVTQTKQPSTIIASTQISELDRVLGSGLTPGGMYLLAGQPGIGKSTLLTQLALALTTKPNIEILYVCSEENASQVATRLKRLNTNKQNKPDNILLLETSLTEDIISATQKLNPALVIVDSIQSIQSNSTPSISGSITQIRASSNLLIHLAKATQIPIMLVGHVTKQGKLAGPKLLEHMVDVVLELEGDRHHNLRLLRGTKNRFGPTDETGLFQMQSGGLIEIKNPGKLFLSQETQGQPGSALSLVMEGTRPLLVEIQALTVRSELAIPRRVSQGIPHTKLQLICAILTKHLGLKLDHQDVFVNVTSGIKVTDPAADLCIALAIISSYHNQPLPPQSLSIGELGLLGEIRAIPFLDKRLKEAKTLNYTAAFTPNTHKSLKNIRLNPKTPQLTEQSPSPPSSNHPSLS